MNQQQIYSLNRFMYGRQQIQEIYVIECDRN